LVRGGTTKEEDLSMYTNTDALFWGQKKTCLL
jgi:hypothetical protein